MYDKYINDIRIYQGQSLLPCLRRSKRLSTRLHHVSWSHQLARPFPQVQPLSPQQAPLRLRLRLLKSYINVLACNTITLHFSGDSSGFKGQMQRNWAWFDFDSIKDYNRNNHNPKFYIISLKHRRDIRRWKWPFFFALQTERFEETSENCRNWILWRHNWWASRSEQRANITNMGVFIVAVVQNLWNEPCYPLEDEKCCRE